MRENQFRSNIYLIKIRKIFNLADSNFNCSNPSNSIFLPVYRKIDHFDKKIVQFKASSGAKKCKPVSSLKQAKQRAIGWS